MIHIRFLKRGAEHKRNCNTAIFFYFKMKMFQILGHLCIVSDQKFPFLKLNSQENIAVGTFLVKY